MFTGIIEERGEVLSLDLDADAGRLTVRADTVTEDAGHGDSIAVGGVCLTVVDRTVDSFTADVMAETLRRTTIGALRAGDRVNLERSVRPTTRLGGHAEAEDPFRDEEAHQAHRIGQVDARPGQQAPPARGEAEFPDPAGQR